MTHYVYVFAGKWIHMWGRTEYGDTANLSNRGSLSQFVVLVPNKLTGRFDHTTIWMEAPVPEEDLLWFGHLEKMG